MMNVKKTETLQIRITPAMKQKLKFLAKEQNTTIASLVENAIIEYFDKTPTVSDRLTNLEQKVANIEVALKNKEV